MNIVNAKNEGSLGFQRDIRKERSKKLTKDQKKSSWQKMMRKGMHKKDYLRREKHDPLSIPLKGRLQRYRELKLVLGKKKLTKNANESTYSGDKKYQRLHNRSRRMKNFTFDNKFHRLASKLGQRRADKGVYKRAVKAGRDPKKELYWNIPRNEGITTGSNPIATGYRMGRAMGKEFNKNWNKKDHVNKYLKKQDQRNRPVV